MRIPGPSTILSAASTLREEVTDLVLDIPATVGDVLALISRAGDMLDRVERLLVRAEGLLDRGEALLDGGEALLDHGGDAIADAEGMLVASNTLLLGADVLVAGAERTAAAAAATVVDVDRTNEAAVSTVGAAAATVVGVEDLLRRTDRLLAPWEPIAGKVAPLAADFAHRLDDHEVAALAGMVDKLPQLLRSLEEDVLPMLGKLDQVGPDVHEILETVHEMTLAISGLPGAGFLKRRGEKKEDEESD